MEALLRWLGYGLCHQLPERSFAGGGLQVPVCARDTGIYLGFAIAFLFLTTLARPRRASEPPPLRVGLLLGAFILVMAVDGVTSYAGLRTTNNDVRLITGLLAGYALAAFTAPLFNSQAWRTPDPGRVLGNGRSLLLFVLSIPVAFATIRYLAPSFGVLYPVLVAFAVLLTFTAVNAAIVCLLPWFEQRAERLLDLKAAGLVALSLTLLELAGATGLRVWLERLAARIG